MKSNLNAVHFYKLCSIRGEAVSYAGKCKMPMKEAEGEGHLVVGDLDGLALVSRLVTGVGDDAALADVLVDHAKGNPAS